MCLSEWKVCAAIGLEVLAPQQEHHVVATTGGQPLEGQVGERGLDDLAIMPDLYRQDAAGVEVLAASASRRRTTSSPSSPEASAICGSCRYSGGRASMASAVT